MKVGKYTFRIQNSEFLFADSDGMICKSESELVFSEDTEDYQEINLDWLLPDYITFEIVGKKYRMTMANLKRLEEQAANFHEEK